ncbi:unnamed protein product [Dicrocoelium dendriticum]|nr:unnamed protein product [Dicrocoelium dendriticum]
MPCHLTWMWIVVLLSSSLLTVTPSSEKILIKQLINNYEKVGKIGRPVKNNKETVVVGYGLSAFQLLEFNEKDQVLTINVWAKYTWIDQLLRWDPANFTNIREVRIPPKLIWTPDIVLYNYVDERLKELRDVMLNVDYQGRVFWSPPAIFKSNCRVDIRNFPFDHQVCYLRFASWTQHSEQLDLQFLDNRTEVTLEQETLSNEWTILARPAKRFIMMSEQCGKKIPDLTFFLFLKRNPAFYAYLLVFPCILLSLLTGVIFWLPPHVPAKTLLGMNIFVAFSLLLKILASSTPSASTSVPYLGYYYCLNMVLLSLSTFISTVVIHLHSYSHKQGPVPPWLVRMVDCLAKPLRISRPMEDDELNETISSVRDKAMRHYDAHCQEIEATNLSHMGYPTTQIENNSFCQKLPISGNQFASDTIRKRFREQAIGCTAQNTIAQECLAARDRYFRQCILERGSQWSRESTPEIAENGNGESHKFNDADKPSDSSDILTGFVEPRSRKHLPRSRKTSMQFHDSLRELREALKVLMHKVTKKDAVARREREWHFVVMTIDRFFFWVYLTILIFTVCYLLIPHGRAHTVEEVIQMHADEYTRRNKEIAAECLLPKS